MRSLFVIICMVSVTALRADDIRDTDGISIHHQVTQGLFEWRVSAKRLLQTPEWNAESEAIPLAPEKACRLAGDWLRNHGFNGYVVETVHIVRCDRTSLSSQGKQLGKRFYYKLEFTKPVEVMFAYVLMDGTLLEPKVSPPNRAKK